MEPLRDHEEETVFVSVPAYRDSECQWTIRDLFRKAKYPSRLRVGICFQLKLDVTLEDNDWNSCLKLFMDSGVLSDKDASCLKSDDEYLLDKHKAVWILNDKSRKVNLGDDKDEIIIDASQIKLVFLRWFDAKGPCLARHLAHQLYRGEKFQLSIDSHMRFDKDWDEMIIRELELCSLQNGGSISNCIITTYPGKYELPNKIHKDSRPVVMVASKFEQDKMLRLTGKVLKNHLKTPSKSPFWAAGFNFSLGKVLTDVPYDPSLDFLFFGEEASMIVRLFTHGYDFFAPTCNFIYHLWTRSYRPTFREVKSQERIEAEKNSQNKVHELLRISMIDDHQKQSNVDYTQDKYGLGIARTLQQYEEFSGVNFQHQTIAPKASFGLRSKDDFIPELSDIMNSLQSPTIATASTTTTPSNTSDLILQLLSLSNLK